MLRRLDFGDLIVSAAPNAGYADRIRYRNIYRDNLEYFGQALEEIAGLGVNIIGGCCGTDPGLYPPAVPGAGTKGSQSGRATGRRCAADKEVRYDNNPFIRRLYSGEKVVIAELDPPHDANDGRCWRRPPS